MKSLQRTYSVWLQEVIVTWLRIYIYVSIIIKVEGNIVSLELVYALDDLHKDNITNNNSDCIGNEGTPYVR